MANLKKGQLTTSPQWARHLRPDWKRIFWSGERMAEKQMIDDELREEVDVNCDKRVKSHKRVKKHFGMEHRYTEEAYQTFYAHPNSVFHTIFPKPREWRLYYHWYETAKQRDQAMERLSQQKFLDKFLYHEYRPIER